MEVCRNITEDLSGMFALQRGKSEDSCRIPIDDEGNGTMA